MEECFRCGKERDEFMLCEAICKDGIRKICRECIEKDEFPVIKKKKEEDDKKENFEIIRSSGSLLAEKQPMRRLVDNNFMDRTKKVEKPEGVIENFHWIIMRKRRGLKISQKQLAEQIGESERDIRMAESGVLPKGNYPFLVKLENFLGVKLMEDRYRNQFKTVERTELDSNKYEREFDIKKVEDLKIDDLRKMKEKKEKRGPDDFDSELEDISPEEIDRIIYGR
jgi:ribosome-binding protein aMBF1 (putative translation factor)